MDWFGGSWECRATLYVPRDVRAHVQTSAGSVSVRDLVGCELGVKANAGKIELTDVLRRDPSVGGRRQRVNGHDVGGLFDVETHAGSVRLEIADLQPGEHRIRATMGSVRVELARGLDVCVETHTSLGSVRNSYPSREAAPTKLVLDQRDGLGARGRRLVAGHTADGCSGRSIRRACAVRCVRLVRLCRWGASERTACGTRGSRARADPEDGRGGQSVGARRRRAAARHGPRLSGMPSEGAAEGDAEAPRGESERLRILELLEQQKITAAEAADLLAALGDRGREAGGGASAAAGWLKSWRRRQTARAGSACG